ncbi:Rid family detoxifying hydrolase [Aerococcaceae bacterium zg-B36]|uniref:Rid family detoxifying hydrolase n=1 Tax=Aerococcaceae bacterium zg-252 TaxID=2796928 RepID=UPI001BD806E7|nr:Rid family detoxifying hydrolase [Aerococcaceae bacterium zg-B36]
MKKIESSNAPKAVGPYSQGIAVDNLCFISGQLPINPTTGNMSEDIIGQTEQSLLNIGAILESEGLSYDSIIKTTVLLTDINDFKSVNEVYETFFKSGMFPARTAYQVVALPMGAKIEIEVVASRNES